MPVRSVILIVALLLVGCEPSGPATTRTSSSGMPTLAERAEFLLQYVTFRRTYETLDFDVRYENNGGGGGAPAPSDWDVRLVATVPAEELQAWALPGVRTTAAPDADWLTSVPTSLDLSGISEWFDDGHRVVGLDRARRIVVHRAWSS